MPSASTNNGNSAQTSNQYDQLLSELRSRQQNQDSLRPGQSLQSLLDYQQSNPGAFSNEQTLGQSQQIRTLLDNDSAEPIRETRNAGNSQTQLLSSQASLKSSSMKL